MTRLSDLAEAFALAMAVCLALLALSQGLGAVMGAHRVAYESQVGPVPPGLQLDHV